MVDINQVFGWMMRNVRLGIAVALGVVGSLLGWLMMSYIIAQIGSGSPELAVYHNMYRVGVSAIAGILGAALVLGKADAR